MPSIAWTIGRTANGKMQSAIRLTTNDSGAIGRIAPALTRAAIWRRSVPSTRGPSSCGARPVTAAISCAARSGWCVTSPMM